MNWPSLQENHFHYLLGLAIILTAWLWLRGELTPTWVLSLFVSEDKPSVRLVSAFIMLVFTLCMQAKGRLPLGAIEANYTFIAILFGLGTTKVIGSRWAARPPATTVNAPDTKTMNVAAPEVPAGGPRIPD